LGRKVLGDNGARLKKFGRLIAESSSRGHQRGDAGVRHPLADLGDKVTS